MKSIEDFNEVCHEELLAALENAYKVRSSLKNMLLNTYNQELINKIKNLNKIINNAEFLVNRNGTIK